MDSSRLSRDCARHEPLSASAECVSQRCNPLHCTVHAACCWDSSRSLGWTSYIILHPPSFPMTSQRSGRSTSLESHGHHTLISMSRCLWHYATFKNKPVETLHTSRSTGNIRVTASNCTSPTKCSIAPLFPTPLCFGFFSGHITCIVFGSRLLVKSGNQAQSHTSSIPRSTVP